MPIECLKCQSEQVIIKNYAKKTGALVGAIAGAASGVAAVMVSTDQAYLSHDGSFGHSANTSLILSGIIGGTAGCKAGAALGEVIDDNILDNLRCQACGHNFSINQSEPPYY